MSGALANGDANASEEVERTGTAIVTQALSVDREGRRWRAMSGMLGRSKGG